MSDDSSEKRKAPKHELRDSLNQTISKAGKMPGESSRDVTKIGGQLAQSAAQSIRIAVDKLRRKLGEDYYAILKENSLVLDTLSRSSLLVENKELLSTAFNIPWATTLLWSAAAGSAIALQRPLAQVLGDLLHYAPGHIKRWDEINQFMDSAVGG